MKNFKEYANSFQTESKLGLKSIGELCEKLGNPQDKLKFIHVAGTNGKGSVCAFLQCILSDSGLKVGKFISPNMLSVCERISVDGTDIGEAEMNDLLTKTGEAAHLVEAETGVMPTQFEIWTACAFLYFEQQKCDVVVLEVGLGGRLDATNIIKSPLCAVITRIDIDHTSYLGDTVEKIAFEKAGIIKENTTVITSNTDENIISVIADKADNVNATLFVTDSVKLNESTNMKERFDYKNYKELEISLAGVHQAENASLAAETAMHLGIDEKYIRSGLAHAANMGRFEKLSDAPLIVFDGAHNLSGTKTLVNSIDRYLPKKNIALIYGAMADKDISASVKYLADKGFCEKAKVYTVTVKNNPRAETAQNLAKIFSSNGFWAEAMQSVKEAINRASDNIIICGSLYLYKDVKEALAEEQS